MKELIVDGRIKDRQVVITEGATEGVGAEGAERHREEAAECGQSEKKPGHAEAGQASILARSFFIAFCSSWRIRSAETSYCAAS